MTARIQRRASIEPPDFGGFEPSLLAYLKDLTRHNNREWFETNRARYDNEVLEPAMRFIVAMEPRLRAISPHYRAVARRLGGSLMRVYRDVRFARDKRPYKTNVGIQFRHALAGDVHAPGYYVHIAPDEVFLGVGCWRPDRGALARIRERILAQPAMWRSARDDANFQRQYALAGDSLKRPPRGYPPDHPFVDDLRRTDFLGLRTLDHAAITEPDFVEEVAASFAAAQPFMRFLCRALDLQF